jgi:acyl carrier protein
MDSKQIDELGRRVIAERLDVNISDVVNEVSFIEDFGADAMSLVEIVLDIEEETGIKISDHEIDSIRTVGDFMNLVKRKNDERQSS